jgi:hypothetical protein
MNNIASTLNNIGQKYNDYNNSQSNSTIENLAAENLILRQKYGYTGMFYSLDYSNWINIGFIIFVLILIMLTYYSVTKNRNIENFSDETEEDFGINK